jgi:hypothetical protein
VVLYFIPDDVVLDLRPDDVVLYFRPDNVAKDTSQEKENVETIEKKLQDALPGVKIVTVKRTAETEFEKLGHQFLVSFAYLYLLTRWC